MSAWLGEVELGMSSLSFRVKEKNLSLCMIAQCGKKSKICGRCFIVVMCTEKKAHADIRASFAFTGCCRTYLLQSVNKRNDWFNSSKEWKLVHDDQKDGGDGRVSNCKFRQKFTVADPPFATKDLYFQLWYALFVDIFFDGEDVMLITGGTVAPYQRKADDMGKPDYDSPGRYIEFKPE